MAIAWMHFQHTMTPDKPFFVFFAPGALHAPHHTPKEWRDKYAGKFDEGWDKYREETLARQKQLGVVPQTTQLAPWLPSVQHWDQLSAQRRREEGRRAADGKLRWLWRILRPRDWTIDRQSQRARSA